jgi:site-specific DNA-methyltransferase (adenine-specific)
VSYFLWNRDRDPKEILCSFNGIDRNIGEFDVLVRNNTSAQILKKVLAKHTGKTFCDQLVKARKPFGMATNFADWVPEGTPGAVQCYVNLKGDVKYTMPQNIVDLHGVLGKWKVLTSSANGAGQECDDTGAKSVLANTIVTKPAEACTETLIVAGAFNTKKEAVNYSDYMKTKFYRFMLSLRTITQHITVDKFAWVPDLGSYANPVTDADLFAHFNLTKKEIEHINSTIK